MVFNDNHISDSPDILQIPGLPQAALGILGISLRQMKKAKDLGGVPASSAPPSGTTAYEVKLYKLKDTLHQVLLIGDYFVHAQMPKYGEPGISTSKVDGTKFPPTDRNTKLVPCLVSGEAPKQDLEKRVIEERATVQSLGVLYLESPKVTDETVTKKLVDDTLMEIAVSKVGGTCVDWMERVVLQLPQFDK
ncbi:hypothetical protein C8R42DRAFT_649157 [Lentinula raphanica]|nr:hypothetical protein C8R42DRAFT_649157 [Lentinula raphanica]